VQVMREAALPGPVRPRSVPDATLQEAVTQDLKVPDGDPALTHSFPTWLADAIPTQIAGNYDVWLDAMRQIKSA